MRNCNAFSKEPFRNGMKTDLFSSIEIYFINKQRDLTTSSGIEQRVFEVLYQR